MCLLPIVQTLVSTRTHDSEKCLNPGLGQENHKMNVEYLYFAKNEESWRYAEDIEALVSVFHQPNIQQSED